MTDIKTLFLNKLLPKKVHVSKTFGVSSKDVKFELQVSPIGDKAVAFNVHITDRKPFSMLTSTKDMLQMGVEPIECEVFGLKVAACGLTKKMPQCEGCIFNH